MSRGYVHQQPVRRSHYNNFRRQLFVAFLFIAAFIAVGLYIYFGLRNNPTSSAKSTVENVQISTNQVTYTNDYFQFKDTPTWILDKSDTTDKRIVYHKFQRSVLQDEMIVYINQTPIPLDLATPRVLPVHIVNANGLAPTNVSSPCVGQYAKDELHKVKEVSINGATMLCDPDSPQYYVSLSEINGDYRLNLKRPNGQPIQYVVTYKNDDLTPQSVSLENIVNSFQPR